MGLGDLLSQHDQVVDREGAGAAEKLFLDAAVAANLAKGENLDKAVANAKKYITKAIRNGFPVGSGHSPIHHFYRFWKD